VLLRNRLRVTAASIVALAGLGSLGRQGRKEGKAMKVRLAIMAAAVATSLVMFAAPAGSTGLSAQSVRVPNVIGKKLPLAEYYIKAAGLRVGKEDCDCTFGVVIKSHWYVCIQNPRAGRLVARGTRVGTFSARSRSDC
jgi:hypothetical protein